MIATFGGLALAEAGKEMQPEFHSGVVTRPLSAVLWLAMMGCPALRARGELAAGACAPMLGWDRGESSSAGARAWWGACGTGARGPYRSSVPSQSTANLADPAELRDTNHEARRMASTPVLMTGA